MEHIGRYLKVMEAFGILNQIWNLIKVIRNSKKEFVRQKQFFWTGGTDRQTHRHTDTQTDPCIELRYAQLKIEEAIKAYQTALNIDSTLKNAPVHLKKLLNKM